MKITSNIELDDLVESITDQFGYDDVFEFIKKLDLTMANWDFTDRLIEYFEAEKNKKPLEEKHND